MIAEPARPSPKRRGEVRWFHWALAAGLGVQAIASAPIALDAVFSGLSTIVATGLLGVASIAALAVAGLALLGRFHKTRHAAVFLGLAGCVLLVHGFFVFVLASCASIVNCGSGPPAYHVLTAVVLLAALDLAGVIALWVKPRREPSDPQGK